MDAAQEECVASGLLMLPSRELGDVADGGRSVGFGGVVVAV
jgi:hypothetical protein